MNAYSAPGIASSYEVVNPRPRIALLDLLRPGLEDLDQAGILHRHHRLARERFQQGDHPA